MSNELEVIVVGAGQAGLTTSYFLTDRHIEHVVVERGRVDAEYLVDVIAERLS